MKALICGAGSITRDLIRRLGGGWTLTLVDKSSERLDKCAALSGGVSAVHAEDASSPVALAKAGLEECDFLLALTDDDQVNQTAALFAREKGVPHVAALLRGEERRKSLSAAGIHVIRSSELVASNLFYYLQDPRIRAASLAYGPGAIMEINASDQMRAIGKPASFLNTPDSRLAGVFRDGVLIFPGPGYRIKADDRLIILGRTSVYDSVCGLLQCGSPHFPLAYGPGMLIVTAKRPDGAIPAILEESRQFAQSSHIRGAAVLQMGEGPDMSEALAAWPQDMNVKLRRATGDMFEAAKALCRDGDFGLTVISPPEGSLLKNLTGRTLTGFARDIDRPLLISRGTAPYERMLVPFSATAMSELAVDIAVDLARQSDAEISLVMVETPEFLSGSGNGAMEATLERVKELSRIHQTRFVQIVKQGNPIREITALSAGFDLMIVGSSNRGKGLLSPNIGESLTRRAECSVLLVAG